MICSVSTETVISGMTFPESVYPNEAEEFKPRMLPCGSLSPLYVKFALPEKYNRPRFADFLAAAPLFFFSPLFLRLW